MTFKTRRAGCAALALVSILTAGAGVAIADAADTTVAVWKGDRMFEDFSARTQVSPDARWILRTTVDGDQELLTSDGLKSAPDVLRAGLESFERAVFCGNGRFLRLGTQAQVHAWFGPGSDRELGPATQIPVEATPACSLDSKSIAHFTSYPPRRELPPPTEIYAGSLQSQKKFALGGVATGAVYSSNGAMLYVIARQPEGASAIFAVDPRLGTVTPLVTDLDAWPFAGVNLAIAPDDSQLIVALASLHKPDNGERQKPLANRWLSIARFDLKSKRIALVKPAAGHDESDPSVAGGRLYWVHIDVSKSVLALPVSGGVPHTVVSGIEAYLPAWTRDGKRIAYVFGQYRLVDWALSQDIGIVTVDSQARAVSAHRVFIQGNHEDFTPDWSPNGKWIVWHSHRDPHEDPAYYDAPGTTDEIWIRSAEDLQAPERPLTHGLWETGWAYWSPDGRKVIYTSWDRDGEPGRYYAAVSTVDPDTGNVLKAERLRLPDSIRSPQIADWSPDGKEIAVEDASGPKERTLWIVSADLRTARKVTTYESETYGGVSWMPDGKALAFAALDGDHMQIYSVFRDGTGVKRLSDGKGNLVGPRVSPDGKWIACARVDTIQTLRSAPYP